MLFILGSLIDAHAVLHVGIIYYSSCIRPLMGILCKIPSLPKLHSIAFHYVRGMILKF